MDRMTGSAHRTVSPAMLLSGGGVDLDQLTDNTMIAQ
jgi:hypothetical protein